MTRLNFRWGPWSNVFYFHCDKGSLYLGALHGNQPLSPARSLATPLPFSVVASTHCHYIKCLTTPHGLPSCGLPLLNGMNRIRIAVLELSALRRGRNAMFRAEVVQRFLFLLFPALVSLFLAFSFARCSDNDLKPSLFRRWREGTGNEKEQIT